MFPSDFNPTIEDMPSLPGGDWPSFSSTGFSNTPGFGPSSNIPFPNSFGFNNSSASGFPSQQPFFGGNGGHMSIQTNFSGDKFYPSGKKMYDSFHKDFYHENGQKAYDGFHKHLYYENGKQAYDGFHHTVFYPSGQKAYDGFFNRAYYSNGKEMGSDGTLAEPMFHMTVQGRNSDARGEFALQLSRNFYARVLMESGKMRANLFMEGACVV